jgi:hypothetical protein
MRQARFSEFHKLHAVHPRLCIAKHIFPGKGTAAAAAASCGAGVLVSRTMDLACLAMYKTLPWLLLATATISILNSPCCVIVDIGQ